MQIGQKYDWWFNAMTYKVEEFLEDKDETLDLSA